MNQRTVPGSNELQIVYVVDPGARHKLGDVQIAGNKYFLTEKLRARMQVRPSARFESRGRYSQALLTTDIRGMEDLYRANGFQAVKITSSILDNYDGHQNDLAVRINIDEGPQTLVEAFRIDGNHAFSQEQLAPFINTASGQPFSEFNVAQDRDNILNYYFNHGFPHASFEAAAKPVAGQANRMDVTFTIQ